MVLTLEIKGPLSEKLGASARKVFNAVGGSIGRLSDNSWILPDPYISGRHALIRYTDGAFYIEDTSTNGVFVNSQENRLVKGQPYALKSGDWIFIEPYEIKASISEGRDARDDPWQPFQDEGRLSAGADEDFLSLLEPGPRAARQPSKAPGISPKSVENDHFPAPRVVPEPVSGPGRIEPLIPPDYDPLITENHPPPWPASPPPAAPKPPVPAQPPVARSGAEPLPDPFVTPPGAGAMRPAVQGINLQAVLAGAGLEDLAVSDDLARDFGEILRVVVGGLMELLQARQRLKSEFRMEMTTFRPADNNPLKFSPTVDHALHNLLVNRIPGYMGPVEAFEDAFEDVRNHQIAMLAGIRVAFEAMLREFDPEHLQTEFNSQLKKGALISVPAKLRYWELYRDRVRDMVKDRESTFRTFFGEEFTRAYEEQLKRLKEQPPAQGRQ